MKKKRFAKKQCIRTFKLKKITVGLCAMTFCALAFANPQLGNIGAGRINIQQTPNSTVINQSSQKGIINWRSFNIGKSESTHFQQPQGGITLNRISPTQGVSQIFGRLTATGKIILINPAGIYFGPSAFVHVGGIIATTADLADRDFLKGNYQFNKVPGYSGAIVNEGTIVAANHGLVALVAPGVVNQGKIQANLGHVVLASGEAFTMNFSGDGLINFAITAKTSRPGIDRNGRPLRDGVRNTGSLIADGGKIMVSAQAASGVLDNVINMQGVAQARSVSQKNGEIIFSGDPEAGIVRVAANVNASGKGKGETGGSVKITGHQVLIDKPTVIDVSGDKGGGDIYIGGNYKGGGPLPNSKSTVIMPDTMLLADAITYGNGGNVIVWSDDATKAYGKISARGGALGGDGGFVETSSHHYLDVAGIKVDTSAPKGKRGTWLLDPRNVFITTAATSGGSFSGGNPDIFTPVSDNSTVSNTDIQNNLALTDVTITTGATGAQAGDIFVNAPITWGSANTLELNAANNIFINNPITGTAGTLALSAVNAPNSITTGPLGAINVANFQLLQGEWVQNSATLPAFNVSNNFNIATGIVFNDNFNATFARFAGGDGGASPFRITDKYGLEGMATLSLTNNYNLINNIDLSGTAGWNNGLGFQPISPISLGTAILYDGTFNGQFFTISNLTMVNTQSTNFGLFPNLGSSAVIENLTLLNPNVTQNTFGLSVGILTGANVGSGGPGGTINNINIVGGSLTSLAGGNNVGAIAGFNNGPISNSSSSATVIANGGFNDIGGIAGLNSDVISNSANYGTVGFTDVQTLNLLGGFVGESSGPTSFITNSLSTGQVIFPSAVGNTIGGFAAVSVGSIGTTNSFWDIDTSGQATSPGGGIGKTDAEMKSLSTFSSAGWSIGASPSTSFSSSSTWSIVNGSSYPYLSWTVPPIPPTPPSPPSPSNNTTTTSSFIITTDIANVLQESTSSSSGYTNPSSWTATTVSQNIDEIMKEVANLYDAKADKIEIAPNCAA